MKTKRLAAAAIAMLLALTTVAVVSSPAAAHGEEVCRRVPVWEEYQVRVGTDIVNYYDGQGQLAGTEEIPRYETRRRLSWGTDCTVSYNHTHTFCQMWVSTMVDQGQEGNMDAVEVGSVPAIICQLWVTRGH